MKTKKTELVPFGGEKQVALAFYSIGHAIDRQTKALEAQTVALARAIHEKRDEIEALADVLRATNEILIQRHLYDKAGKDLERVREQIEKAKKSLLRKA